MSSVYLCGPISGLTYDEARYGWRRELAAKLDRSIGVRSPMRQEGHLKEITEELAAIPSDQSKHFFARARSIVSKDKLDVVQSDVVIANLLGSKRVSIGSMVELGWASAMGKPIVVVMEPDGNPHNHIFVREIADFVVETVDDAATIVNALLSEGL